MKASKEEIENTRCQRPSPNCRRLSGMKSQRFESPISGSRDSRPEKETEKNEGVVLSKIRGRDHTEVRKKKIGGEWFQRYGQEARAGSDLYERVRTQTSKERENSHLEKGPRWVLENCDRITRRLMLLEKARRSRSVLLKDQLENERKGVNPPFQHGHVELLPREGRVGNNGGWIRSAGSILRRKPGKKENSAEPEGTYTESNNENAERYKAGPGREVIRLQPRIKALVNDRRA